MSDVVKTAKSILKTDSESKIYKKWLEEARKAFDFYEGEHFTEEEIATLQERSQPIIPVNRIAVNVDNIAGQEISSRTRIGFASRSFDEDEKRTATALTAVAQYIQEKEDTSYKLSIRNKHRLICGLGYIERSAEEENLFYGNVNPFEVVPDSTDMTPDYSDSRHIHRIRWADLDELKKTFPEKAEELTALLGKSKQDAVNIAASMNIQNQDFNGVNTNKFWSDFKRNRIRIAEYQYKKSVDAFRVVTDAGQVLETFDKDEANKLAARDETGKKLENTVKEIKKDQMWSLFYAEDIELANVQQEVQNETFSLQVSVLKRTLEGVPYGIVKPAIPVQDELNKRRSKALHLMNTNRVIMDVDAVEDLDELAQEVSDPSGIIVKRPGKELQFADINQREISNQIGMMQRAEQEIDMVMGIFPESIGQPTNAVSGIAIRQRQVGSSRNQVASLDTHRADRKKFGRDMLSSIQSILTQERIVEVIDDDEVAMSIPLNQKTENGVQHDVRTVDLDIYVEETPEYDAPPEQLAELVQQVMMNGQGHLLTQPDLLIILGVQPTYAKRMANAAQKALAASPEQQEAAGPNAGGTTATTPSPDGLGG